MAEIVLARLPNVICQCVAACHMPFRDETGEWSAVGCLRPAGHAPPCSLDGTGDITYRDEPLRTGPMLTLRRDPDANVWRATCHRCGRRYELAAIGYPPGELTATDGVEDVP